MRGLLIFLRGFNGERMLKQLNFLNMTGEEQDAFLKEDYLEGGKLFREMVFYKPTFLSYLKIFSGKERRLGEAGRCFGMILGMRYNFDWLFSYERRGWVRNISVPDKPFGELVDLMLHPMYVYAKSSSFMEMYWILTLKYKEMEKMYYPEADSVYYHFHEKPKYWKQMNRFKKREEQFASRVVAEDTFMLKHIGENIKAFGFESKDDYYKEKYGMYTGKFNYIVKHIFDIYWNEFYGVFSDDEFYRNLVDLELFFKTGGLKNDALLKDILGIWYEDEIEEEFIMYMFLKKYRKKGFKFW